MLGLNLSLLTVAIRKALAVWTPATLFAASEQGVWYDPSDLSTLFQDSAGTVPVTATGQPVGKMLDKSGRGNHATQATTASKPILQQDANGKYYLAFDGIDDGMATASVNFTATDKMTAVVGVRKLSDASIGVVVGTTDGVGTFAIFAPRMTGAAGNFAVRLSGSNPNIETYSSATLAPVSAVITMRADIAAAVGAELEGRMNATSFGFSSGDAGAGAFANKALSIGRRDSADLPFNGRIYQLIIRGALTDAAGITAAETFVNSKTAAY